MNKGIIVSLVCVALVIIILIGAVNAFAKSPDGNITLGDVVDGVGDAIGGKTTTAAPGTETTPAPEETTAPGGDDLPVFDSSITYLKNSQWIELDYDVIYEPEYTSSGQLVGYIVYLKIKLSPSKFYNLAYDCSMICDGVDDQPGYFDYSKNAFIYASKSGSVQLRSDENGFIKFAPCQNGGISLYRTATDAQSFANTLKENNNNFVIQITDAVVYG